MTLLSNVDYKQRFSSIAKIYEKISNQYTVNRRAESFKISPSELITAIELKYALLSFSKKLIGRTTFNSFAKLDICFNTLLFS